MGILTKSKRKVTRYTGLFGQKDKRTRVTWRLFGIVPIFSYERARRS